MLLIRSIKNIWKDTDRKELLSKSFTFLSIRVIGVFAGYLFTYLITTKYGANIFGLVSLCFSIFLFASILGRLGMDINLVNHYADDEKIRDKGLFYKAVFKSFFAACLLALLLYALKDYYIATVFKKPELEPYIFWTVLAIPFWTLTLVCGGLLRARKMNRWFAFLNIPGRMIFALLALLVVLGLNNDPIGIIKAHFYGIMFLGILAFVRCTILLQGITFRSSSNSWTFLRRSIPMMLSSTILVVLGWMDTFVLGIFNPSQDIGIYNVAIKIAGISSFVFFAVNSILAPKLAQLYQTNEKLAFRQLVQFSAFINGISSILIIALILGFHDWLLRIFGPEFAAGDKALFILCAGQLIMALTGSVGVILQMTGNQVIYQNIMVFTLCINILLNFILIPLYGIQGAALATAISVLIWNISGMFFVRRKLHIDSFYNPFQSRIDQGNTT